MSKYGIRSAILTMLYLRRDHLKTKEEVKQHNLGVRKAQLKKEKGETSVDFTTRNHYSEKLSIKLLLSDDLESFYTSLQNQELPLVAEHSDISLIQKLIEEDVTLVENRNPNYLNTLGSFDFMNPYAKYIKPYNPTLGPRSVDAYLKKFEESSDPESIFSYSAGHRWTQALLVTLKSVQHEMRKRASNDLSDMKLKKQRVNWYNRSQYTYKFVKKEDT